MRVARKAALLLCTAAAAVTPCAAAGVVALRLIGLNDFHGYLEATASLTLRLAAPPGGASREDARGTVSVHAGGAAAIAGLVDELRRTAPHSLFLASGDLFGASPLVSTLFRHESTVAVMNAMGLELDATGNHEYDAGIAELKRIAGGGCATDAPPGGAVRSCAGDGGVYRGADFPLLAANVVDANSGRPPFAPSLVKRYGGVPVGVIGAVTRSTPSIVVPSGIAGLRFDDEATSINRAAAELRRRGVKAMVLAIHEGGELAPASGEADESPPPDWNDTRCPGAHGPIFEIAKRLAPEIRVIFSAHTHQGYRCLVGGRTIIQATSYGRGLAVVDVALDPRSGRFVGARTRSWNLPVFNERTDGWLRSRLTDATPPPFGAVLGFATPDSRIAEQVARYMAAVAPQAERPVGRIAAGFSRAGDADSAAGRLVADAQLAATRSSEHGGAQLALMNPGGIRSDLDCAGGTPPCTVSFGQAFTMQPFGNSLVVMTLSGAQLKALLETQQSPAGRKRTMLSPSAGLSYRWRADAADGERVGDLRLDGEPVQPQQRLRVVVNSFLAEGGDGFVGFKAGSERQGGGQDLDALTGYLSANEPVLPSPLPRVTWQP